MFKFYVVNKKSLISGSIIVCLIISFFSCISFSRAKSAKSALLKDGISVPVIMYHSVLNDKNRNGDYVVSPETLESDIKYLIKNGYSFVLIKDLISYVYEGKELPEKPVVLTFDDGYYNNMLYLPPILKKYNAKASIAVVGKFTDIFSENDSHNPNYSHLTWEDIKEMSKNENIEFSNHSYNMHENEKRLGCFKLKSESEAEYEKILSNDLLKMQDALKEKSGISCEVFTYPYGKVSNASLEIIKKLGFKASLSCFEKTALITKDKNSLYLIGRYNRPSGISTEKFMKKNNIK